MLTLPEIDRVSAAIASVRADAERAAAEAGTFPWWAKLQAATGWWGRTSYDAAQDLAASRLLLADGAQRALQAAIESPDMEHEEALRILEVLGALGSPGTTIGGTRQRSEEERRTRASDGVRQLAASANAIAPSVGRGVLDALAWIRWAAVGIGVLLLLVAAGRVRSAWKGARRG